jgi:hypothetical protein
MGCRARRLLWTVALLGGAASAEHRAALAAPAVTATPPRDGRGLLPGDAAIVVRADPAELERIAALVRSLGGQVGLAANVVSLASASSIGFDATARAGWGSIGVDVDQPVFVALGAIDPARPRALWHVRAVARLADGRLLADWAGRTTLLREAWRADRPVRGALAALLGLAADPRAEAMAARALTERGAIAVGVSPSFGALVFVRRVGPYAALDAFALAEIGRIDWTRDGAAILARLDAPVRDATMTERTAAGARALGRPGLVIWTRPAGLFDAGVAWSRPPATCDRFRSLAAQTSLVDGAVALRASAGQVALDVVWGAAPGAPVTTAWSTADDGLLGPPLRGGAVLGASLYLAGTERLRAAQQPEQFSDGWVALWRGARGCGRTARALLLGFAWPEMAARWLSDVAAVSPHAARLVDSARNIGFAARRVSSSDRRGWQAVLEGSFGPAGIGPAQAVLDAIFGGRRAARRPRRHTAWDGVYLRPYELARGKRGGIIGVGIGDRARRWRLGQPVTRSRRPPGRTLARAAADGPALLRQLAPTLSPGARALAAAAERRVGLADVIMTTQPDGVRISATVRRR